MFHSSSIPREDGRRGISNWFNSRAVAAAPTVSTALAGVITAFTGIPSYQESSVSDGDPTTEREKAV